MTSGSGPETKSASALRPRYDSTLVASGLVDDVLDISALQARPIRYSENDFICRHGDPARSLWVVVSGSVAVRDQNRTLFIRRENEVLGEQTLAGNGHCRWYDLVVNESQAELLEIDKAQIEEHPEARVIWRNIVKVIALKLKDATVKTAMQSRQLEDDTQILHAYTNEFALAKRLQSGGGRVTQYEVHRAIIWFSDVVDFSRHIATLAPRRTADIVQRFFNAQSEPIALHGGYIDKFIGDGLMAFWVLSDGEDPRSKCIEALRAAEEATEAVSRTCIGKQPLHLRIGLHIGLVLSGDFGSTTRHQFTLIGPEVNKAARLEQVHHGDMVEGSPNPGPIRLSAEFRDELGEAAKRRYSCRTTARAKNIGEIELYISDFDLTAGADAPESKREENMSEQ